MNFIARASEQSEPTEKKRDSQGLVKLTGTISQYKSTRASASFIFTDSDRNSMGVVAIAASLTGLGGAAVSTASNASDTEEDADYLEFELDGKAVKGWVWRSPFNEGDVVDVAAEWQDGHYELAGIARPSDRMIALYPHCSRGRSRHIKNSVKWWLLGTTGVLAYTFGFLIVMSAFFSNGEPLFFVGIPAAVAYFLAVPILWLLYGPWVSFPIVAAVWLYGVFFVDARLGFLRISELAAWGYAGLYSFGGIVTFDLARRWMVFSRLSEKVFKTIGLSNPSNVDLVKSSKAQSKPGDPAELGVFYFRY